MFKANLKWIKTKSNHVNSETKKPSLVTILKSD